MKSLIKKLSNTELGVYLRNLVNIKPVHMSLKGIDCVSISDAFAWRTDNKLVTKFKYSDILNIFISKMINIKSSIIFNSF